MMPAILIMAGARGCTGRVSLKGCGLKGCVAFTACVAFPTSSAVALAASAACVAFQAAARASHASTASRQLSCAFTASLARCCSARGSLRASVPPLEAPHRYSGWPARP